MESKKSDLSKGDKRDLREIGSLRSNFRKVRKRDLKNIGLGITGRKRFKQWRENKLYRKIRKRDLRKIRKGI